MTMEKRISLELRAKGRKLEGYAATFNTEARIADFIETIAPGAFRDSLAGGRDIIAMVDHDSARVLGRTRSGTLRLEENGNGLASRSTCRRRRSQATCLRSPNVAISAG